MKTHLILSLILSSLLLAGCEKAVFEEESDGGTKSANVVLSVVGYEGLKGTARSTEDLTKVCSRLSFVVYQDGQRKKTVNQKLSDDNFGRVELSLDEGDYEVLVLGHSSTGKDNPTVTTLDKIQFTNITEKGNGTGYSDTFYCLDNITVGDQPVERTFTLTRAVAMFRLETTDVKPSEVSQMWFRYTGGSGAFNAYTGYGCVNSTQVVTFDLTDAQNGQPLQFDLYTFPHDETDLLRIQARAFNASGDIIYEHTFENVPVERNSITQYTGAFFTEIEYEDPDDTGTPEVPEDPEDPTDPTDPVIPDNPEEPDAPSMVFKVETAWASVNYYTF